MSPARFVKRPERVVPLVVVAIWLLEASCGSSGTTAPDAAGGDGPPDVAATDLAQDSGGDTDASDASPSDGAPADFASDGGTGDVVRPGDGGGVDGTDAGNDPCYPPCRTRLYGGCPVAGTCVSSAGTFCYSNGVIVYTSPPGGTTSQTITKNGAVCATLDATLVYRDPSGAALGTITITADGNASLNCTGEAPVTIPASCTINCVSGMCPP